METKTLMELNIKENKKSFYKYIVDKRKTKENVGYLQKEMEVLVTQVGHGEG